MTIHTLAVDWLLAKPGEQPARPGAHVEIVNGMIGSIHDADPPGNGLIALPGLANAHDHARGISCTALGGFDKPLESWLLYLGVIPGIDPYLVAASSLGRSALRGAGRVMVHYTRNQGLTDLVDEARQVARAATDVGVHIGFAVAMRDRNPISYANSTATLAHLPDAIRRAVSERLDRPALPPGEQLALADEIARACHAPDFNVQYGPAGVQWCSHELLELVAEASARTGRQVHMHLLETIYQREWADQAYPGGIVRYLKDIGLLSPRLTLAHCTHCTPDELAMIAESGAIIAVNTGSNLCLRSGIAPVAAMIAQGCRIAMGLDGLALDEDDDAMRELRLLYHLHKGIGYEAAVSNAQAWQIGRRHGRESVSGIVGGGGGTDGSAIVSGEPADLLLLDAGSLMEDRLFDDVDVFDFVLARANASHIRRVVVAGKTIVEDGRLRNVDYPALRREMLARMRASIVPTDGWRRTVQALDLALGPFHKNCHHLGCC